MMNKVKVSFVLSIFLLCCNLSNNQAANVDPFFLINQDDFKSFTKAIESGIDIDKQDKYGRTLLNYSCLNNKSNFAEYLISKNADVEKADIYNYRPIHQAISNSNVIIIQLLIQKKCNINALGTSEDTPLHIIAGHEYLKSYENEMLDIKIAELLIKNGADTNLENSDTGKPFHAAYLHGKYNLAKFLLPYTKDVTSDWIKKLKDK